MCFPVFRHITCPRCERFVRIQHSTRRCEPRRCRRVQRIDPIRFEDQAGTKACASCLDADQARHDRARYEEEQRQAQEARRNEAAQLEQARRWRPELDQLDAETRASTQDSQTLGEDRQMMRIERLERDMTVLEAGVRALRQGVGDVAANPIVIPDDRPITPSTPRRPTHVHFEPMPRYEVFDPARPIMAQRPPPPPLIREPETVEQVRTRFSARGLTSHQLEEAVVEHAFMHDLLGAQAAANYLWVQFQLHQVDRALQQDAETLRRAHVEAKIYRGPTDEQYRAEAARTLEGGCFRLENVMWEARLEAQRHEDVARQMRAEQQRQNAARQQQEQADLHESHEQFIRRQQEQFFTLQLQYNQYQMSRMQQDLNRRVANVRGLRTGSDRSKMGRESKGRRGGTGRGIGMSRCWGGLWVDT